jgi:hypothetical protein
MALTKTLIEAALEEEMSEHWAYDKGDLEGMNRGTRDWRLSRRVVTDNADALQVVVTWDRNGTLEHRVGRVHPIPGRRRGDPPGDLLDQRDRDSSCVRLGIDAVHLSDAL